MIRFILFIIFFILAVWLGLTVAKDPGLALFTYHNWSVEMPLWFAGLSFIAILVLFYFIVRFFAGIDSGFYRFQNWLRWRRKNKAYSKTNRGLLELIEARFRSAENNLLHGIEQSDAPLINYLGAAYAAHEYGAYEKRDKYLDQAHAIAPHAELAIGLTQSQLQFDQGQLEQALATLNHVKTLAPYHPVVLKLLEKLYVRLADWDNLLKLIPSLRKAKIFTEMQLTHLEQHVYQELFNVAANKPDGFKSVQECWANVPRQLQKNPRIVYYYTQHLLHYPESERIIEELIHQTIKKTWDTDLVKVYGQLVTKDPKKQLAHAEKWLKLYPHQAMLFLTLSYLSLRCQLWGKARNYLDESLKLATIPEIYAAYGKLFEQLGDMSSAVENYRKGYIVMNALWV